MYPEVAKKRAGGAPGFCAVAFKACAEKIKQCRHAKLPLRNNRGKFASVPQPSNRMPPRTRPRARFPAGGKDTRCHASRAQSRQRLRPLSLGGPSRVAVARIMGAAVNGRENHAKGTRIQFEGVAAVQRILASCSYRLCARFGTKSF